MQICIRSELLKWVAVVSVYKYPTTYMKV